MAVSSITEALKAGKTIRFTYMDAKGKVTQRHAEPYEIKNGKLYSWDRDRDASRQFFLADISEVSMGETFVPRFPIIIPPAV